VAVKIVVTDYPDIPTLTFSLDRFDLCSHNCPRLKYASCSAADFDDFAGGIGAEHVGQLNFHRILAGADDKIQGAIDGNGMNLEHNFARGGLGSWNIFEPQDFRAAEFFKDDGFQAVILKLGVGRTNRR